MRYVDLKTFLTMPSGTVYMIDDESPKGTPCHDCKRVLCIKGDTMPHGNDWAEFDLTELKGADDDASMGELFFKMFEEGESVPLDPEPVGSRYGLYPEDGELMFYVLDEADTRAVIGLLEMALRWRKGES
jgi:hypothetical protein